MASPVTDIDGYIATFPPEVQVILEQVRATIAAELPQAQEAIKYSMPTFTVDGRNVIHFAGWKHHISVYPAPSAEGDLERRIAPYRSGQATAKFPMNQPIPYDLIAEIVDLVLETSD